MAHRLCMKRLVGAPFPCSVMIPWCLLSPVLLCAMQAELLVFSRQGEASSMRPAWHLPWAPPLCKTACGMGVFRNEPVFYYSLSIFVFLSLLDSCLVFNISATKWFPLEILAINSLLPVPESTWHFLPQAEKCRVGAEIKPAKSCTMLP